MSVYLIFFTDHKAIKIQSGLTDQSTTVGGV